MTPTREDGSGDGDLTSRAKDVIDRAPGEAKDLKDTALGRGGKDKLTKVQKRWKTRLAWPVLVAAILSVPAVFMTLLDEPWETIGHIGLYAVSVVLVFETVVLFFVSPEKLRWMRKNWWLIGLTGGGILAVIFSIGPLQLFRVLRSVGALRVFRAKQMARAGKSLGKQKRSQWRAVLGKVLATVIVGVFVVLALIDPDSEARQTIERFVGEDGAIAAAIGTGIIAMGGMYLLVRDGDDDDDDTDQDDDGDDDDDAARDEDSKA